MAKKKDKSTEGKKSNGKSVGSRGAQLIDKVLPALLKRSPAASSTAKTKGESGKASLPKDRVMQLTAGGIVLVAVGALALVGISSQRQSGDEPLATTAAEVSPSARATSEAAAARMIPAPTAPEKAAQPEPAKAGHELKGKVSKKVQTKKELASKSKSKAGLKKAGLNNPKQKAAKSSKRAKKALAARSPD